MLKNSNTQSISIVNSSYKILKKLYNKIVIANNKHSSIFSVFTPPYIKILHEADQIEKIKKEKALDRNFLESVYPILTYIKIISKVSPLENEIGDIEVSVNNFLKVIEWLKKNSTVDHYNEKNTDILDAEKTKIKKIFNAIRKL